MKLPDEKKLKEFQQWGVEPPSHDEHGSDSQEHPISEKLISGNPRNWRMVAPGILQCDTDFGPFTQKLARNDVICIGEKDGLPLLKELTL